MLEAYKKYWEGYIDFKGRTNLGGYWWAVLAHFLVTFIISFLLSFTEILAMEAGDVYLNIVSPFSTSFTLLCLLPSLAIAVRRLRDAGHSWTNLFWILLPLVGPIILLVKLCGATSSSLPGRPTGQPVGHPADQRPGHPAANNVSAYRAYTQPQPAAPFHNNRIPGACAPPTQFQGGFRKLPFSTLQPYTGSGVCDVCNKPLTGQRAYVVPNAVFYASPGWRESFRRKNGVLLRQLGLDTEKEIERMQKSDHSAGSAVCNDCIRMFAE